MISPYRFPAKMLKSLFDQAMEKELVRLYVEIFAGSSGKTWPEAFHPFFLLLQAAYKDRGNFRFYHSMFFKSQSFGPGGNIADTAGSDEVEDEACQPLQPLQPL